MNANQHPDAFPEIQTAIHRVILSLDSFLLNGIPYGVLQRSVFPGFLEQTASRLLTPLASLERLALETPASCPSPVREALAALRAKCQELIDLVTGLSSFRTLPLPHLRSTLSQIPLLRAECVQLLQELEVCFQTLNRFYPFRPSNSIAAPNDFLANLEQLFEEERTASTVS